MAFDRFCFTVPFKMPSHAKLSVIIGVPVAGCAWPRNSNDTTIGQPFLALLKADPTSASAAELSTFFIICDVTSTAPLCCWLSVSSLLKKRRGTQYGAILGLFCLVDSLQPAAYSQACSSSQAHNLFCCCLCLPTACCQ